MYMNRVVQNIYNKQGKWVETKTGMKSNAAIGKKSNNKKNQLKSFLSLLISLLVNKYM